MYVSMWLVIGVTGIVTLFLTGMGVVLIDRWWMRKQRTYTILLKNAKEIALAAIVKSKSVKEKIV